MLIDITGVALFPGNFGFDCPGDGMHFDKSGKAIPCCCDECDYMLCCIDDAWARRCAQCPENECPRKTRKRGDPI